MCLFIDTLYHTTRGHNYVPLVADRPLLVRKAVDTVNGKYYSPFMGTPVPIGVVKKTQLRTFEGFSYGGGMKNRVEHGFHTFLYSVDNRFIWNRLFMSKTPKLLIGVIPVGAKYFRGKGNEVVSNQIIYFESEEAVLNYFGVTKLSAPYTDKVI